MKYKSKYELTKIAHRAAMHGQHNWRRRQNRSERLLAKRLRPRVTITPPSEFNLSTNYDETVACLESLKGAALKPPPTDVKRKVAIDLASIKTISTAGILVLAAEIDRWRQLRKAKLAPRNIADWDVEVKRLMVEIGFFELLDVEPPEFESEYDPRQDTSILRLVTGNTLDTKKLAQVEEHLRNVADVFEQDQSIYAALIEAAYNSIKHGYPDDHNFRFPTLTNQWWATGSWSPLGGEVKFMVYDQGVGIAETLPAWDHWEHLLSWASRQHPLMSQFLKEHANMIEAALEVSRTSLTSGHGQGLKDVVAPVDQFTGGSVRIISGKGQLVYQSGGKTVKTERAHHLGGTLIEWTIPVL